jgi:rhodanese-related sulfurtransferase
MKTITTEELRRKLEVGPVALYDVRGDIDFEYGHIPGAKTAPLGSLTFRVASLMNRDSFVVVYSAGPDCDLSAQAVIRLEGLGMQNVHRYTDGIKGWQEAGFEVVESTKAKVHARGEVKDVRPLVVDRDRAYGGAFKGKPEDVGGAGG